MTKVLHVALIAPGGYSAKPFMEAFLNNGFNEYHSFDYQLNRFEFGKEVMQQQLIRMAEQLKPDLVFVQIQGGDVVEFSELSKLSKIAFTVNYTFDKRTKEQTQWLYKLVPELGLVCFSNQEDVDECNQRGYKNVMVLHSSANEDIYKPSYNLERKGVVFIGNNFENTNMSFPKAKERREMVELLKKEFPDYFHVFGLNWGGTGVTQPIEEVRIYSTSEIAINQNNFDTENYTSDRLWRIMSTGTFCLTKYFKGLEKMFTRGVHLDWWETFDELIERVSYYLSHPNETEQIGYRGMLEVKANHTWSSRVKEMMAFIENLQPNITDERNGCIKAGGHVINGVIPGLGGDEDAKYHGMSCDCGRLNGDWYQCECGSKQYQFRWVENI